MMLCDWLLTWTFTAGGTRENFVLSRKCLNVARAFSHFVPPAAALSTSTRTLSGRTSKCCSSVLRTLFSHFAPGHNVTPIPMAIESEVH